MKLRKGQTIKFKAINEFTGRLVTLTGVVAGDYVVIKKNFPLEMGDVDKKSNLYLVDVPDHGGRFVVHTSEVIQNKGTIKEATQWILEN